MVQTIAASPSGAQQSYFPAPSTRLLLSTPAPLVAPGRTIIPSHAGDMEYDDDHYYQLYCRNTRFVSFEEW